ETAAGISARADQLHLVTVTGQADAAGDGAPVDQRLVGASRTHRTADDCAKMIVDNTGAGQRDAGADGTMIVDAGGAGDSAVDRTVVGNRAEVQIGNECRTVVQRPRAGEDAAVNGAWTSEFYTAGQARKADECPIGAGICDDGGEAIQAVQRTGTSLQL